MTDYIIYALEALAVVIFFYSMFRVSKHVTYVCDEVKADKRAKANSVWKSEEFQEKAYRLSMCRWYVGWYSLPFVMALFWWIAIPIAIPVFMGRNVALNDKAQLEAQKQIVADAAKWAFEQERLAAIEQKRTPNYLDLEMMLGVQAPASVKTL